MGALPSRETQRRGLYSHRHGRNRRNEVMLIPLTAEFFPDDHCPLFERLYQARHHRTAKYYYRAVRPASTDWESDYYCQTIAHAYGLDLSDPEGLNKDGVFETSFSDSIEGLYHRLVRETEYCMCESDDELRQRYMEQLRQQQRQRKPQQRRQATTRQAPGTMQDEYFGTGSGAYVAGYRDALNYMQGKEQHTHRNRYGTHVTSPAAFYLRPVPCAIVSRYDAQRPHAEEGVEFLGSTVKVLGMFGLFPTTIPATVNGETIEQHMLKATMFVDKDVGDQILGNVVMLAVHMYVRQCMEAHIRAPFIPMVPFILRTPISNIPMLQFVREMRVRLHALLDAGTPRNGVRPDVSGLHGGVGNGGSSNSLSSADGGEMGDAAIGKHDSDAFLFEEDIPSGTSPRQLFTDASETKWLRSHPNQSTNVGGKPPILMVSGVSVQTTPLKHPSMTSMSHVHPPAWATATAAAAAANPPLPQTNPLQQQQQQAARSALLLACRRNRFRIWVEDGRLCVWASAAYARRGCLILAQQLTLTVASNVLPLPRSWNYRGLLRSGIPVPVPMQQNDVFIVGQDMPAVGLYQGDVVRCSTLREIADYRQQRRLSAVVSPVTATTPQFEKAQPPPVFNAPGAPSAVGSPTTPEQSNPVLNYSSNHASNVLLQDYGEAPAGAFWVHVAFEREPVGSSHNEKGRRSNASDVQQYDSIAYRQTNVEEVLLSWIKGISIQTRDALETEEHWVRDPVSGEPVRVDRYVIRRVEHDGIRHFIGVTPRFIGQQRRLEKGLMELRAMEGEVAGLNADDGNEAGEDSEGEVGGP
ncbi:hypothetical protein TraAM80_01315 [Trypanosoma rangeli]|uniref:Uncharacterized protein n=1 Tax=Trypanosoma rangeli TaxID=5698 RepID=A0A3R7M815_TRYRA|nr:uncharacterized protein TraAM80_01315 [Trypanosoma rangeli]RNF10754.1 hypothetical protein TraAM80_01315 [Trypanosoma rangeli]|eukprot:RNF10754.1 hypothetical protein TraAM80_01315 [Trypanosoma rangeli]